MRPAVFRWADHDCMCLIRNVFYIIRHSIFLAAMYFTIRVLHMPRPCGNLKILFLSGQKLPGPAFENGFLIVFERNVTPLRRCATTLPNNVIGLHVH